MGRSFEPSSAMGTTTRVEVVISAVESMSELPQAKEVMCRVSLFSLSLMVMGPVWGASWKSSPSPAAEKIAFSDSYSALFLGSRAMPCSARLRPAATEGSVSRA